MPSNNFERISELAVSLEFEVRGNDRLHFETSRADDGQVLSETSYGLTGPIVMMQNLMAQLANFDPAAARVEIAGWPRDDEQIFARLRVWAAGQTILSPSEAAEIFRTLPDIVFWGSQHERDLLYALRDRWADLSKSDRAALEHRLRDGSYPWPHEPSGGRIRANAFDRVNRLHWLSRAGVVFDFNVAAAIDELRALVPEWTEQAGDEAADSRAPQVYSVGTDRDPEPLLETPVSAILAQAQEAGQMDFRAHVRREPFSGLSERRPIRALAALTHAARQGNAPRWAWSAFLSADRRPSDPVRLIRSIAGRLLRLELKLLNENAYPVSEWMKKIEARLYGDAASVLPALWKRLIEALRHFPPPERKFRSEQGWANAALNAPIGRLVDLLMKDPLKNDRKVGSGFPRVWIERLDQLLNLPDELRCQALVLICYHLNWLHSVDPSWTNSQLLPLANSDGPEGDAFWEGLTWSARVPNRVLFSLITLGLIERTRRPRAKRHHSTIMAGFLLAGWGADGNATEQGHLISDEQLREILIWSDDEFRIQLLWQLEQWSKDAETTWRDRVIPFFGHVWPKQRALRTPAIASRLADFLLTSGDLMPKLVPLVVPRLVPVRGGSTRTMLLGHEPPEGDPVERFPAAVLELLWAILSEDFAFWPYRVEDVLERLASHPATSSDPRLSELRRRRSH